MLPGLFVCGVVRKRRVRSPLPLRMVTNNWTPDFIETEFHGEFVEFPRYEPACLSDPKWGQNPDAVYDCGAPGRHSDPGRVRPHGGSERWTVK